MPNRGYKLRMYPNRTQERALAQWSGHSRWVWNWGLESRRKAYARKNETLTSVDLGKRVTTLKKAPSLRWLADVPTDCLTQKLRDLDTAFANFFDGRARYPRFKPRRGHQSARVCIDHRHAGKVAAWSEGAMVLPNIGRVKLRGRTLPGAMSKMVTVCRDAAGRYWTSFAVEEKVKPAPEPVRYSVGIDAGARYLATLSCAERIENPRNLRRHAARLTKEQQHLARQKKGSNRRKETRKKIARIHARIADCRRENMHRATTCTVHENQVLCVESLEVKEITASAQGTKACPGKGVAKRTRMNRALLDAAMGETLRQIRYKSEWYGRACIEVAPGFPSSALCSTCGTLSPNLTVDDIRWTCEACGTTHDRDENAAVNIEVEGLKHLIHPEDTGGVRASGDEGRYPHHAGTPAVAVSARIGRATQTLSGTASAGPRRKSEMHGRRRAGQQSGQRSAHVRCRQRKRARRELRGHRARTHHGATPRLIAE